VVRWRALPSAVGGLRYSVLIDGSTIRSDLLRHRLRLPAGLDNGVLRTQVLATDLLGQQVLSPAATLRVDGQAPVVKVGLRRGAVTVRLHDRGSGLDGKATKVAFGDGSVAHRGGSFRHAYDRPGSYRILVRARDRAGNRVARHFEVRVP
jgi:hypothetical protein